MKKSIIVSSIGCVLGLSILPILAEENVVVVTANRMEQNIDNILTDVEVIDRSDIERIQPQSLVDLLVNIAGVDFTQVGGHGQDSSVFVRGANSNQLLVLVDGIRVGSATLGNKEVTTIPVAQIERIEIVKGPRAAIWGSDAIGGVIQIFTRHYQSGEYRVAATVGSNATGEVDTAIGFGSGNVSNTLSVSYKESDGFDVLDNNELDDDGYDHQSVALRGDYQVSEKSILDWVLQSDRGERYFDNPWSPDTPLLNKTEYKNHHWNLRYSLHDENWHHQFSLNASRDSLGDFETNRQQLTYLSRTHLNERLTLAGGAEFFRDDISQSLLEFAEEKRTTKSGFVNLNFIDQSLLADLAVRVDDVENVARETTINFGSGWRFNENHLVSLNYGEGFKAPTFNDLYYPFGGNPDLKFETSTNHELVYKGMFSNSRLTVSVYDSKIDNLIQWAPDSNGNWAPQNIGKAKVEGVDLSYQISYGDYSHKISADKIDAIDANSGDRLIRRAKNHFGYEFAFGGENFDWFMQLQWVGERPDLDYQTFTMIDLDSYTRVNLGLAYKFNQNLKIQLKVNDAFDEAPTLVSGYFPVQRETYLTVSYQAIK